MKKLFCLVIFCCSLTIVKAQTEDEWFKKYDGQQDWVAKNYIWLIDFIKWKPVNKMKTYIIKDIKATFLLLSPDDIRQLNIDGIYYCSVKHDDMFQLWNLYYPEVSKETWDTYCKGFIGLLNFDGFITKQ